MLIDENNKERHILRLKKIIKEFKDEDSFTINKNCQEEIDIRYRFFIISYLFGSSKIDSEEKFWMIINNMNDKSVKSLCKLYTSYEKIIFKLFLHFVNNNNEKNVYKFIEFTKSLGF